MNDDLDLTEVLFDVVSRLRQGEPLDREVVLARHPRHAAALRTLFGLLDDEHQTVAVSAHHAEETLPNSAPGATAEPTRGETPAALFGDYEILREIARGGMGVVYEARQRSLNRIVALKMILAGSLASPDDVHRFLVEAEAAAGLDHPGIVPIHEVGEVAGQHYFSMAYVEGKSLAERVKQGPLPVLEAVEVTRQIAEALAYAHDRGVVHRDLKPSNVLLDGGGKAKVTDFGLAKRIERDSQVTATGQILGTPSYMPPEQASGKSRQAGPASDIYSLGAVLYCLVSGKPPFQAASVMETLIQVLEQDVVPLRLQNAKVPHDVDAICQKCLAKNPQDRYPDCHALAADLKRVLAGEPASVSSSHWGAGMLRALQRNRDDVHLHAWSAVLTWFALIVGATEGAIQMLDRSGPVTPFLFVRVLQVLAFAGVVVGYRRQFFGRHPAVVQIRNLSLGFLLACWLDVVIAVEQHVVSGADEPLQYYGSYPAFLIYSGIFFLALARQYWGMCYALVAGFFTLAVLTPWLEFMAPVLFGLAWSSALLLIAQRLRSLQEETAAIPGD